MASPVGYLYDTRVFWFSEVLFPVSSFSPLPPSLLVHCIGLGPLSSLDDTLLWAGGSRRLCATTRVAALQTVDIGRVWFCLLFVVYISSSISFIFT